MQSSPPRMETTLLRPAHDLLRRSLPWTEVRTGDASQKGQRNRIGPQPMISNLNPFTTATASDCPGSISHHSTILPHCGRDPVITSHFAGTDPKPRSNLIKTKFRNGPCQIGRTTGGKLDDLMATVKRLFRFHRFRCFLACFLDILLPKLPLTRGIKAVAFGGDGRPRGPATRSLLAWSPVRIHLAPLGSSPCVEDDAP